jgi:uncharacterized protein YjiS (DUF1127 family)
MSTAAGPSGTTRRTLRSQSSNDRSQTQPAQPQPSRTPSLGEDGEGDDNEPRHPETEHSGASRPDAAQGEPTSNEVAAQLQELRAWRQREQNRIELARLIELKRKVDEGDISLLEDDLPHPPLLRADEPVANLGAPRPKDPETFTNRDRLQYNCWARDCETIFRGAPRLFATDVQRVDFGVRFLDETMRSTWETHRNDQLRQNSLWAPTWTQLKAVMLDCLGPEAIRRLSAHTQLKRAKQKPDQDPNHLMSELNVLWSELGDHYTEEQRKMDFLGALLPDIQKELLLRDQSEIPTVTALNILARFHWNKGKRTAMIVNQPHPQRERDSKSSSDIRAGNPQTRKKPRRISAAKKDPTQSKLDQNGPKGDTPVCWTCNQPGHVKRDCPMRKSSSKGPLNGDSGKGKGQRN